MVRFLLIKADRITPSPFHYTIMAEEFDYGTTIRGFAAGQKVFERYTLQKMLGRGGMGVVWLAHDEDLERDVALKFLPETVSSDAQSVRDLKRETRRSLELTHPHIVRIYDFMQSETMAAISMEYVVGDTLASLKVDAKAGHFEVEQIKVWVNQLCAALAYAHTRAEVVHRDLKPANLMIDQRGDLKIADFGIAASVSDSVSRVSVAAGSSGTPVYMSPQQMMGEKPAVTDDIYALGATLYELLTSKPPFHSGNVMLQVMHKVPPPMEKRRREFQVGGDAIPETWEETIASCLAKEGLDRPISAADVASRLRGLGPISTPPPVPAVPPVVAPTPMPVSRPAKPIEPAIPLVQSIPPEPVVSRPEPEPIPLAVPVPPPLPQAPPQSPAAAEAAPPPALEVNPKPIPPTVEPASEPVAPPPEPPPIAPAPPEPKPEKESKEAEEVLESEESGEPEGQAKFKKAPERGAENTVPEEDDKPETIEPKPESAFADESPPKSRLRDGEEEELKKEKSSKMPIFVALAVILFGAGGGWWWIKVVGPKREAVAIAAAEQVKIDTELVIEREVKSRLQAERDAAAEAERLEQERLAKEEADRLEVQRLAKEEAERLAVEAVATAEFERLELIRAEKLKALRAELAIFLREGDLSNFSSMAEKLEGQWDGLDEERLNRFTATLGDAEKLAESTLQQLSQAVVKARTEWSDLYRLAARYRQSEANEELRMELLKRADAMAQAMTYTDPNSFREFQLVQHGFFGEFAGDAAGESGLIIALGDPEMSFKVDDGREQKGIALWEELSAGEHLVAWDMAGRTTASREVTIKPGELINLGALQPGPGTNSPSASSTAEAEKPKKTATVLDKKPTAISREAPVYPRNLRGRGISGQAVVRFTINERGRVENPEIVSSTNSGFDRAALDCVKKWRFTPGEKAGKPVEVSTRVSIVFNLDD